MSQICSQGRKNRSIMGHLPLAQSAFPFPWETPQGVAFSHTSTHISFMHQFPQVGNRSMHIIVHLYLTYIPVHPVMPSYDRPIMEQYALGLQKMPMRLAAIFVSRHHPDAYLEFKGKDKIPELYQDLLEERIFFFWGGGGRPLAEQGLMDENNSICLRIRGKISSHRFCQLYKLGDDPLHDPKTNIYCFGKPCFDSSLDAASNYVCVVRTGSRKSAMPYPWKKPIRIECWLPVFVPLDVLKHSDKRRRGRIVAITRTLDFS